MTSNNTFPNASDNTSNANEPTTQVTPPAQGAAQFSSFAQQPATRGGAAPMPPSTQTNPYQAAPMNAAVSSASGGKTAAAHRMNGKLIALVVGVSLVFGVAGGLGGGLAYGAITGAGSSNSQQMQAPGGAPGGSGSQGGQGGGNSGQSNGNSQNGQPGEPPSGNGQSGSGQNGNNSSQSNGSNSNSNQKGSSNTNGSDSAAS